MPTDSRQYLLLNAENCIDFLNNERQRYAPVATVAHVHHGLFLNRQNRIVGDDAQHNQDDTR